MLLFLCLENKNKNFKISTANYGVLKKEGKNDEKKFGNY
mgnify:CR=1 FL=1|jgi:hypothetical protein